MHPGARILLAILSALALPGLSFLYLAILSLIILVWVSPEPARALRLVWRSRWLLMGMILVYAFQVSGDPVFMDWSWSPSQVGVTLGLMQSWRLALLLLLIDRLVLQLPLESLLAGLASLLRPMGVLGIPVERIVVRLGLTLHALNRPSGRQGLLPDIGSLNTDHIPERFSLTLSAWAWTDGLLLGAATIGWIWLTV